MKIDQILIKSNSLFFKKSSKKKGFTLIELLVVIAIVSLMSSIVFASLNSARGKARDAKRMSDLRSISLALELYYDKYGTYRVVDTNWLGGGEGFVAWEDGLAYITATTRILNQQGFLSAPRPDDPTQFPGYMLYI